MVTSRCTVGAIASNLLRLTGADKIEWCPSTIPGYFFTAFEPYSFVLDSSAGVLRILDSMGRELAFFYNDFSALVKLAEAQIVTRKAGVLSEILHSLEEEDVG